MFDKKKIIFNSIRSFKKQNKKVNLFFNNLSEDVIQRLEINKNSNLSILEILAKNRIFSEKLEEKKISFLVDQVIAVQIYEKTAALGGGKRPGFLSE